MKTDMSLEKAREINRACLDYGLDRFGLVEHPLPPIDGYSLAELVEAQIVLRAERDRTRDEPTPPGGRTIEMLCDDRLVAAIYTAAHYTPEPADRAEPVVIVGEAVLVVVDKTCLKPEECEHGVPDGDRCEDCAAEYKRAAIEAGYELD